MSLNIACVKWGKLYPACFVNILYAMVQTHLPTGLTFQFLCFTDNAVGLHPDIIVKSLPEGLNGWWNKLALFNANAFTPGERVLYLDLDTIITGSLEPLLTYKGDFAILRDFYRPEGYGSGVMLWRAGACEMLWSSYEAAGRPALSGGDQAWIEQQVTNADVLQDLFPGMFASFKAECAQGCPADVRVVAFHGEPKQDNCGASWVAELLKSYMATACTRQPSYAQQVATLQGLITAGQAEQALRYSKGFEPHPGDYEALHLFGICAQMEGEVERARMRYELALTAKPDYAYSRLALAQLIMQQTGFHDGRALYEARFDALTQVSGPDWRGLPYARWQGESLRDKKSIYGRSRGWAIS